MNAIGALQNVQYGDSCAELRFLTNIQNKTRAYETRNIHYYSKHIESDYVDLNYFQRIDIHESR